ncbi:MAG TPA: PHP domain-containing protein, partial [Deltaproteobacteria bacterium]|nr:PHP domain-containing protein [Deltaproteobacteria bacterium]
MSYDLHIHTLHSSDGQYSTAEILAMAERAGLAAFAITDHMDIRSVHD